ncbi:MAG: segregation/condensation protein A [bacterium]
MYHFKLEQFEGPLDLLLKMIEAEELNISEVSLAEIADQFVKYVMGCDDNSQRQENAQKEQSIPISPLKDCIDANELSDFLIIAAKLVYIKSKYLMPFLMTSEDEEEIDNLETQLKIYKEFLDASKIIKEYYENKSFLYVKDKLNMSIFFDGLNEKEIEKFSSEAKQSLTYEIRNLKFESFFPPKKLRKEDLKISFENLIMRLKPAFKLDEAQFERRVTVQERLEQIRSLIFEKLEVGFNSLMINREKSEVIVSFLAVLELIKQQFAYVEQEEYFSEIVIKRVKD